MGVLEVRESRGCWKAKRYLSAQDEATSSRHGCRSERITEQNKDNELSRPNPPNAKHPYSITPAQVSGAPHPRAECGSHRNEREDLKQAILRASLP